MGGRRMVLALAVGAIPSSAACRALDLGTNIVWSADNETGDLSAWTASSAGGVYLDSTDAVVAVTTDQAHTGKYSVKMTSDASAPTSTDTLGGGGLYREEVFPTEAYYSVWYYLPRAYQTTTTWTILSFKSRFDATTISELIDLDLQSQPDGSMTLVLQDHRPQYLQSPLPDPPPVIPIGRWFQIESFYRNASDASGHITIWVDGVLAYDLSRPTGSVPAVYFTPCSVVHALSPSDAELYVDDVAVSWTRITPNGVLSVPE